MDTATPLFPPIPAVGPFNTGTDVRLTLNPDQDYWPAWTDDGRGILYAFVNPVEAGVAGQPASLHGNPPRGRRQPDLAIV